MKTKLQNQVLVKLFIGTLLTPEIRFSLGKSNEWKKFKLEKANEVNIQEVHHKGKDYIGIYLEENATVTVKALRELSEKVTDRLISFSADLSPSNIKIIVFPQIFIY